MKICLIGDLHLGIRSNSLEFHSYFERFFTQVFFPYLKEHNIKTIFQFGDLFDSRKSINLQTLYLSKKYFFDELEKNSLSLHCLIGNHCTFFKNSNEINSPSLLLSNYENIFIYQDFTNLNFAGLSVDIVPWICDDNRRDFLKQIRNSKAKYCFGHFEIAGGKFDALNVCHDGLSLKELKNYEQVFSGHFHTASIYGNVKYLGTPYQLTWIDYGDIKGFYIFDTETKNLEFIQNPLNMFYKIIYDDKIQDFDYWNNQSLDHIKNCYIKLLVINKNNFHLFDVVEEKINSVGVLDLSIVENLLEVCDRGSDVVIEESTNTLELLHNYIESQELTIDINKNKLKSLMTEIYTESLNIEKVD